MSHLVKYRIIWLLYAMVLFSSSFAQDVIRVQFIYGSKPKKEFRQTEKKWFGGIMGGHTGIEKDDNQFLSFEGNDRFHPIDHRIKRHCRYRMLNADDFWGIMGSPADSVRKATIVIPVTAEQKRLLDSISNAYILHPPYDYSFLGMRCASGTYEVLGQLGIVKQHGYRYTCLRVFYPKILRKKLLKLAARNNWTVIKTEGSARRRWEQD